MNARARDPVLALLVAIPLVLFVLVPALRGPAFTLLAGLLALDAVAALRKRGDARPLARIAAFLRPVLMTMALATFWSIESGAEPAAVLLLATISLAMTGVGLRVWQVRRAERTE